MLRTHTCGELSKKDAGNNVTLAGWADSVRISGKIGFIDIRDRYGKTQVFLKKELAEQCKSLHREAVIQVTGEVKARPENQVKEAGTGEIELSATKVTIIKDVPELPLDFNVESTEETRLQYRYLDLRRPEMQNALKLRHKLTTAVRNFLDKEFFLEIETPILGKSTPEGARDYIVPSRTHPGKFFALPQSPQIFKQLLMVAGYDRYFQIARCFRDEDLRADRQPEFTQLDIEMSFIEEEDVYALMERLMQHVWKEVLNLDIQIPFPRMTHEEAMKKHNSDKPDLRKEQGKDYAFLWVTDFPMFEFGEEDQRYLAMHHPFTGFNLEDYDKLENDKANVRSRGYDLVLNGFEIGGGSIRISDEQQQRDIFKALGLTEEESHEKFGFLLEALRFAPPHGGIAFGLDRWAMVMAGGTSIRDVIAFPKNKEARDLMMSAPSNVDEKQLNEVNIKLKK
ncbi:aspartate--tRNA ligase [Candidatus Woesearchaeota archaeon]|jgi:aspartyl-tRNA synthetase|nr:aspartate--tRNA ligase [Candidatus Woesearchaeota archaeon]MBT5740641.1 aspartate--tRNA ligase [Candidatus Woesearchaeota archaeon]MBT6402491.1 aspartate--tRNA ligase [Candidatus Woesearchaeota archaeon]